MPHPAVNLLLPGLPVDSSKLLFSFCFSMGRDAQKWCSNWGMFYPCCLVHSGVGPFTLVGVWHRSAISQASEATWVMMLGKLLSVLVFDTTVKFPVAHLWLACRETTCTV